MALEYGADCGRCSASLLCRVHEGQLRLFAVTCMLCKHKTLHAFIKVQARNMLNGLSGAYLGRMPLPDDWRKIACAVWENIYTDYVCPPCKEHVSTQAFSTWYTRMKKGLEP
jgi:hypothetical protein